MDKSSESDSVVMTGYYSATGDFTVDSTITVPATGGTNDILVVKLNTLGVVLWARR
jgi:hypothetical protein